MTPEDFVERWARANLREQQAAQSHFNELCHLLGVQTPTQADPEGKFFTFEEHVTKDSGGAGRADVWYKGRFAWEYKGKQKDLDAAYSQLQSYSASLNNPPLLVVCDLMEYRIHPQWPNIDRTPWIVLNEGLKTEYGRDLLRRVLTDPDSFYRERLGEINRREAITEKLAGQFSDLAVILASIKDEDAASYQPMQVARFLTKLVFAMFAEDIDLLPVMRGQKILEYIFEQAKVDPDSFPEIIHMLFETMAGNRRDFYMQRIPYFNGGLFEPRPDDIILDLKTTYDVRHILFSVNLRDWQDVEPSIFGTLFERALDPTKRAQLGAHYTTESDIRLVIEPVLMSPLRRRWAEVLSQTANLWAGFASDLPRQQAEAKTQLAALYEVMLGELAATTVLDPACGSGNFLYVSLLALKDLEYDVHAHFKPLKQPVRDVVTPRQLFGIELNTFASELAHVVVWIGYLQWRYRHEGRSLKANLMANVGTPVIDDRLDHGQQPRILNADAILRHTDDGKAYEPEWPPTAVIVGNPPFLGGKMLRGELGDHYLDSLFMVYQGRIPHEADLVTYWFEKTRANIEAGNTKRAGLISTNSIRGGANRVVLDRIKQSGDIFMAWSDNPWVLAGAAVRISITGFTAKVDEQRMLNGQPVEIINSNLESNFNSAAAVSLIENANLGFMGITPTGRFALTNDQAAEFIKADVRNADVLWVFLNGQDITQRTNSTWIVNFTGLTLAQAETYKLPMQHVIENVKLPFRDKHKTQKLRENWWLFEAPRPTMLAALAPLSRYIVTPTVAKYRLFVWLEKSVLPDHQLIAIARDDDYFFGVLHSTIHEIWALRLGTWLGKGNDPRYTPTTTFETFPFPMSPNQAAISDAAAVLHAERDAWLNTHDLNGNGDGVMGKNGRTLTNLYNALAAHRTSLNGQPVKVSALQPEARNFAPRLAQLHDALDKAVLEMYGWADLIGRLRTPDGDEELLKRLLAENLRRAGK